MLVDVGLKKPVEGDKIMVVSLNLAEATLVQDKALPGSSKRFVRLRIDPQILVDRLGGNETFATIIYPEGGVEWIRRSMIRGVYPIPGPIAAEHGEGSLIQMVYDEPMPDPWPAKRRLWPAFSAFLLGMSVEKVRRMLDDRDPQLPLTSRAINAKDVPTDITLAAALAASGALEAKSVALRNVVRPQWYFVLAEDADTVPVRSRLGGKPDLPVGAPWPKGRNGPLSFLGQIDLSQVGGCCGSGLPADGLILFFYDALGQPWGFEPGDASSFVALYSHGDTTRATPPGDLAADARFEEQTLAHAQGLGLPVLDSTDGGAFQLESDEEAEAYLELYDELYGEPGTPGGVPGTWLLGYPYQLQDDMQEQCAEMAKAAWGIESEPAEWRLLLQLASEPAANMSWGDDGFLYYWIRESDLAARDFSHVWCILQTM